MVIKVTLINLVNMSTHWLTSEQMANSKNILAKFRPPADHSWCLWVYNMSDNCCLCSHNNLLHRCINTGMLLRNSNMQEICRLPVFKGSRSGLCGWKLNNAACYFVASHPLESFDGLN